MATTEQIHELIEKMEAEREALLSQAEALSEEQASFTPPDAQGEAGWSAKQQLAHLAEMETGYRAWVERALAEDAPDVTRVRGDRVAIPLTEAPAHAVLDLTAQLRAKRATTLALIESMAPGQFERTASHAMFGSLTAMQWLRSYYRHDRMHRDQMAGRAPEYRPRFVGGQEPDQRR